MASRGPPCGTPPPTRSDLPPPAPLAAAPAPGEHGPPAAHGRIAALTLGALGIVYGDIGTSPLYAMRETFEGHGHELVVSESNVLGVLSLVFWSLVVIISIKYLAFVLRADNRGEGGILALTSLVTPNDPEQRARRWPLVLIGLFGTALLYGDGMITPAISVLSAVEGTKEVSTGLEDLVVPIAVAIIVGLFAVQKRGTASIGRVFGPIMLLWFGTLSVLGVLNIVDAPEVLGAINPLHGIEFFADNRFKGFLALGSVFLVVTGGEALYADMGHFGPRPIRLGWFTLVLPALLLNYAGQGALLLDDPEAIEQPFYRLAPDWAVLPLVVLATSATIIASQALISGVFSLTRQAVQLGYSPRLKITHTSRSEIGQIYIPALNWGLMAACIALVVAFRSSTNLAAAYGVAVTSTMVITALLFYVVLRERFGWGKGAALALSGAFLVIDAAFLGANLFKIPAGGWFPLVVGALVFALLTTWSTGRRLVRSVIRRGDPRLADTIERVLASEQPPVRVPGTAIYLFSEGGLTPPALARNLEHNRVLHERVLVASVTTAEVPSVEPQERAAVTDIGHGVTQVALRYGFMEQPDIPRGLHEGDAAGLEIDTAGCTYFLGAESLVATDRPGMALWRERLFALLTRNATSAANYFELPADRTFTVGLKVEI